MKNYNILLIRIQNHLELIYKIKLINKINYIKYIKKLDRVSGIENKNEIKTEILNICKDIGFPSITDCLQLLIGLDFMEYFTDEENELIEYYNNNFIPNNYRILKTNLQTNIYFKDITPFNEFLLDKSIKMYIKNPIRNEYICMVGYFKKDNTNLLKKICPLSEIETHIDRNFKNQYLDIIRTKDLLLYSSEQIKEKLEVDYKLYQKIVKMSYFDLLQEFTKNKDDIECLIYMISILKFLLFGKKNSINIAYLLFELIRYEHIQEIPIIDILSEHLHISLWDKLITNEVSIQKQVSMIKNINVDDTDFEKQIVLAQHMPLHIKNRLITILSEIDKTNTEYHKYMLYVRTLLRFPWPDTCSDIFFDKIKTNKDIISEIRNVKNKLDSLVYGHDESKTLIQEQVCKWFSSPTSKGKAIGFVGPPGVGKTLLAKSIGISLDIPFVQITLGGQHDGDLLHGHGFTYSSAQPGLIVKKMIEAGNSRCIMFFDELDKAAAKHDSNEIFDILIHLTDPTTNSEFQDNFFQDITFPLDKVIFIFSYNDSSLIDPTLMNRIEEISVSGFSEKEKIIIIRKFIIPEMTDMVNLKKNIEVDDQVLKYIISEYTNDIGVRGLKRVFEKIFLNLNMDKLNKRNLFSKRVSKITITDELVDLYLTGKKHKSRKIISQNHIGIINGLFATNMGVGGILPIQMKKNHIPNQNTKLIITGNQGKIMTESVHLAYNIAYDIMLEYNPELEDKFNEYYINGIHIHIPDGSSPKEGPSAGLAFVVCFYSLMTGREIKQTVSLSGEIELDHTIHAIGGLQEKLYGAKKAGIHEVLICSENKKDLDELIEKDDTLIDTYFKVSIVNNIQDVFHKIYIN